MSLLEGIAFRYLSVIFNASSWECLGQNMQHAPQLTTYAISGHEGSKRQSNIPITLLQLKSPCATSPSLSFTIDLAPAGLAFQFTEPPSNPHASITQSIKPFCFIYSKPDSFCSILTSRNPAASSYSSKSMQDWHVRIASLWICVSSLDQNSKSSTYEVHVIFSPINKHGSTWTEASHRLPVFQQDLPECATGLAQIIKSLLELQHYAFF